MVYRNVVEARFCCRFYALDWLLPIWTSLDFFFDTCHPRYRFGKLCIVRRQISLGVRILVGF